MNCSTHSLSVRIGTPGMLSPLRPALLLALWCTKKSSKCVAGNTWIGGARTPAGEQAGRQAGRQAQLKTVGGPGGRHLTLSRKRFDP